MNSISLKQHVRSIPNFPKPGIMFRDITPLLAHPPAFREIIRQFADHFRSHGVTAIVAAEARGFIFAAPLALELNAAFIPVRKPGKLPFHTQSFQYELEYGSDALHMHVDALTSRDRVLIVDDLLATGGTMLACINLVEKLQASVAGCAFVIELDFLRGREKLATYDVISLIHYADET
jgi:adenine phosphoribosyltransferase